VSQPAPLSGAGRNILKVCYFFNYNLSRREKKLKWVLFEAEMSKIHAKNDFVKKKMINRKI